MAPPYAFPKKILLTLCFMLPCTSLHGQGKAAPFDLRNAVSASIKRLESAEETKFNYTWFELEHSYYRTEEGAFLGESSHLFENTWINKLPYKRLVEVDGKRLTGAKLAAENARYDKAVADRKKLDRREWAKILHGKYFETDGDPQQVLSSDFRLSEVRTEMIGDQLTHVVVADPVAPPHAGSTKADKRFRLWITEKDPFIICYDFELLIDEPTLRRGTSGVSQFQLIDDLPRLWQTSLHGNLVSGNHLIVSDTKISLTGYRRFTSTVTILPASEVQPSGVQSPKDTTSPKP